MKKFLLILIFSFLIFNVFVSSAVAIEKIDINTAPSEKLDKITGIGPVTAQKIIDARPFLSIDDLIKVSGIGEKTLQKIKDQGLACVNCETSVEEARPPENLHADSVEVGPPISYPGGVIINEILPSPDGADEENEWIEIYNSNSFEIDLSGWKISDSAGGTKNYIFSEGKKIPAFGFLVLTRPETKITLNNDQDQLTLYSPDGAIKHTMSYSSAPNSQSYNKTGSEWQWSLNLTPGANNIILTRQAMSGTKGLPKKEKNDNNIIETANLTAALSQNANPEKNPSDFNGASPWFLFFTALVITMVSAVFVLFIKLKFNKKHVRT